MADTRFEPAIQALLDALREQEHQVFTTKTTINNLMKMSGEPPMFSDIEQPGNNTIRADLYYGKGPVSAARDFLESRKRACTQEEILSAMEKGGFDFNTQGWSDSGRLRNLAISLSKNSSVFHRLPNGSWGLVSWYENLPKRGAAKADKDGPGVAAEEGQGKVPAKEEGK